MLQEIRPPALKEFGYQSGKVLWLYAFEPGYLSANSNIADLQKAYPDAIRFFGVVWSDESPAYDLSAVTRTAMKTSLNSNGYLWRQKSTGQRTEHLLRAATVHPSFIYWRPIEKWLDLCLEGCSPLCRGDSESSTYIPSYLIDCSQSTVVRSPKFCKFLALSYVWGSQSQPTPANTLGEKLQGLPQVIKDAMTVTETLGYTYLWVDRLCIPSAADPSQLHAELRNMSYIYGEAEITIIAAAGTDADYGLPGLGNVARSPQPTLELGKHTLVSTMRCPKYLIDDSVWKQRAWTYQEAQASRRRLYFTDRQVYGECERACAWESAGYFPARQYQLENRIHTSRDQWEVKGQCWNHIVEVSRRKMTFEHDNLNAVLGLLERQKIRAPRMSVTHLHGVPFYSISEGRPSQSLALEMCWSVAPCEDRVRNPLFPSWSWAGWSRTSQGISRPPRSFPKYSISIKIEAPGRYWDIDNFVVRGAFVFREAARLASQKHVLRITTDVLDVRMHQGNDSIEHSSPDYSCSAEFCPTVGKKEEAALRAQYGSGGLLVLLMGESKPSFDRGARTLLPDLATALIVAPAAGEKDLWERVGMIDVSQTGQQQRLGYTLRWRDAPWQKRTIRLG